MIPVIDLFAGPGGLGEGFSSYMADGKHVFKIKVSVEKDVRAHSTLLLRAFFRQFERGQAPQDYYDYLSNPKRTLSDRDKLFALFPEEHKRACEEALHAELGMDQDDIRINDAIEKSLKGSSQDWVLIGGPPCQAYSIVGRSRMSKFRKENPELYEQDERHTLYREYLKVIARFRPTVFVMENVKGILSSKLEGKEIFERIRADLRNPSAAFDQEFSESDLRYNIFPLVRTHDGSLSVFQTSDFVVKSEEHGIPQARHRVFLIGVRANVGGLPGILNGDNQQPKSVYEIIGCLPPIRSKLSKASDTSQAWRETILKITSLPWFGRKSNCVNERLWSYMKKAVSCIGDDVLTTGDEYISTMVPPDDYYSDHKLNGFCNHSARGHIADDLYRYFYASCFANVYGRSPRLSEFPSELLPKHQNVSQALEGGMFSDRFRVQLNTRPATTITSHISKDGHYFIHYEPTQCRSLTVREAARLQTFPDNYLFEGPRTSQYQQVGNAVPPLLAQKIAAVVHQVWLSDH